MKVVLYGIPQAGKSFLINKLVSENKEGAQGIYHLEASAVLKTLAAKQPKKMFTDLSEANLGYLRDCIMEEVYEKAEQYPHVIVDANFTFLDNQQFRTIFTDKEHYEYDAFFYLDSLTHHVLQNMRGNQGAPAFGPLTEDKIEQWKNFEISTLRGFCSKRRKDLFVLRGNIEENSGFIRDYLDQDREFLLDSYSVAQELYEEVRQRLEQYDTVVVLDCDKTIGPRDGSVAYIEALGMDPERFKEVFGGHRYSMCQFYNLALKFGHIPNQQHLEAIKRASSTLSLYEPLVQDIRQHLPHALCIGLTAGVQAVWDDVAQKNNFPQVVLGCKNHLAKKHLISTDVKRYFVTMLKEANKTVYAVGDSLIDVPMLEEADKGYLVAYDQLNKAVADFLSLGNPTTIKQLGYYDLHYPGLPVVESIV